PERTIRILVGFPPGGPPDIAARLLADKFAEAWGKPVLVENATGAGGNVAVERAVKAAPDGYTLVMASSAITINPSLYEKLPYDPHQHDGSQHVGGVAAGARGQAARAYADGIEALGNASGRADTGGSRVHRL